MAEPKSWEEACQHIDAQAPILDSIDEWETCVTRAFNRYKPLYSFMNDKTLLGCYHYHAARQSQAKQIALRSRPTAEDLWDAIEAIDPSGARPKGRNVFRKLLYNKLFKAIPLGKVYGTELLWLIPGLGSLPNIRFESPWPTLRAADTDCGAISYPDGHRSEGELMLKVGSNEDQDTLRRHLSLGWVARRVEGQWEKTGHVLVVDMEPGRNHHPWIVMANRWPRDDGEMDWFGDINIHADEIVERDDEDEPGVLPGDKNRTPVGKLINKSVKGSMLRAFGPDFEFDVMRRGSARGYVRSHRGPGLARIMDWYWDPEKKEEVCYGKDVQEYMRFNPETGRIAYCKRATESYAGEDGSHGEITEEGGRITLEQRLANTTLEDPSQELQPHFRELSTSSGF